MRPEGRHILDILEKYAPPSYDSVTDDMTVPFAIMLAEKDRRIERLRAALTSMMALFNDEGEFEEQYRDQASAAMGQATAALTPD